MQQQVNDYLEPDTNPHRGGDQPVVGRLVLSPAELCGYGHSFGLGHSFCYG